MHEEGFPWSEKYEGRSFKGDNYLCKTELSITHRSSFIQASIIYVLSKHFRS